MKKVFWFTVLASCLVSTCAYAHSGGTNSQGCHTNHRTGDYHCHGDEGESEPLDVGGVAAIGALFSVSSFATQVGALYFYDELEDNETFAGLLSLGFAAGGQFFVMLASAEAESHYGSDPTTVQNVFWAINGTLVVSAVLMITGVYSVDSSPSMVSIDPDKGASFSAPSVAFSENGLSMSVLNVSF